MLDMLALHNTSAARTGFQEPFGSFFCCGEWWEGDSGKSFKICYNILQSFTYLHMLLQLSYNILQHGLFFFWKMLIQSNSLIQRWLSLTEWFCFLLKTTNKFWKMSIHSSQVGLDLQNGFVFWREIFTDGFISWTSLQNGLFFFQTKWKNTWFFRNTTKWFTNVYKIFLDLATDWGWLYKIVLILV